MTRREVLDLLEDLTAHIEGDVVTADDDRAIAACNLLRYYLLDHMTDDDFPLTR